MKPFIKLTETDLPNGGCNIYRADFRDMPLAEIETILQEEFQGYAELGYNSFTFNRACGLVSIRKVEIKTINNVLETDMYGLLTD